MHHPSFTATLAAVALSLGAPCAHAQHAHDHGARTVASKVPGEAAAADGEVRKVDRAKGTVTLKHGPLEALGMGPMTMVFHASDAKLLANVKEGDRVRFTPEHKDGKFYLTSLQVVK